MADAENMSVFQRKLYLKYKSFVNGPQDNKHFLEACESGNVKRVRRMLVANLNAKKSISTRDPELLKLMTYNLEKGLERACVFGNEKVVALLLGNGAKGTYGSLMLACHADNLTIVQLLLETKHGHCHDTINDLLFHACAHGRLSIVEYLVDHYKYSDVKSDVACNISYLLEIGPALIDSCVHGHLSIVKVLINCAGITIEHVNTALKEACHRGHLKIAQFLYYNEVLPATFFCTTFLDACLHGQQQLVYTTTEEKINTRHLKHVGLHNARHVYDYGNPIKRYQDLEIIKFFYSIGATATENRHNVTSRSKELLMALLEYKFPPRFFAGGFDKQTIIETFAEITHFKAEIVKCRISLIPDLLTIVAEYSLI